MMTNSETIEDDRIVAKCYVELGYVTKEKGEYDESLSYHRRSMEIYERIDDALSVADSHLNIAEIYKVKGELKEAMSEYEKGLTLYEDVYVEDVSKHSDNGTDVSLSSSSHSDLSHKRPLSKSDENLPQTTLIDIIEKDIPIPSPQQPLNNVINTSTSSLDLLVSPTKKTNEFDAIPQSTASIDDCFPITSEKVTIQRKKSLSSSSISDLLYVNANGMLLPVSFADLPYKTIPEESGTLEVGARFLPSAESMNQNLLSLTTDPLLLNTKLEDTNNSNHSTNVHQDTVSNNKKQIDGTPRLWHRLPNKQLLIIILSIFLTSALFWSLYDIPIKSLLLCPSNDFAGHEKSYTHSPDDLTEQLRKMLTWRKDRLPSLSKDNRRTIEEFLINSDSRTKMTVDNFQKILDMLGLKIVLIPQ